MLNCFTSAYSRVQHFRAHLYHNFSDFGIHVDRNPANRIYPQYVIYERDAPPEAHIMLVFNRRGNSAPSENSASNTLLSQSENPSNIFLYIIQFIYNFK